MPPKANSAQSEDSLSPLGPQGERIRTSRSIDLVLLELDLGPAPHDGAVVVRVERRNVVSPRAHVQDLLHSVQEEEERQ